MPPDGAFPYAMLGGGHGKIRDLSASLDGDVALGLLAALNMVADTLKPLPRESETTRRWSAVSWAGDRQGRLFLRRTPETRTRFVPLTSLWLDMLVLRLMNRIKADPLLAPLYDDPRFAQLARRINLPDP